jgi:hypothetical protein
VGGTAALSVGVSGSAPIAYQWLLNGAVLVGAQSSQVCITNATAAEAGRYQIVVTNSAGAVTSATATVTITNLPVALVTGAKPLQCAQGHFVLHVTNIVGQGPAVISASTDFTHWVPVYTNPQIFGSFSITDSTANLFPERFYRASTP